MRGRFAKKVKAGVTGGGRGLIGVTVSILGNMWSHGGKKGATGRKPEMANCVAGVSLDTGVREVRAVGGCGIIVRGRVTYNILGSKAQQE